MIDTAAVLCVSADKPQFIDKWDLKRRSKGSSMKESLIVLINQIDEIEKLFHYIPASDGIAIPPYFMISDVPEFQIWKEKVVIELHSLYEKRKDSYVKGTIDILENPIVDWDEKNYFNTVKGKLFAIKGKIDMLYQTEEASNKKKPMIFISHSSKDKSYVEHIVSLFDDMGLTDEQIFCSSIPGYDIPLGKTIFEYLLELFREYDLHIIFVHSANYYQSPISLNEMGAAWVLKSNFTSFLIPAFDFSDMKGVVNNASISIKLDNADDEVKDKLNQLYDQVVAEFGVKKKAAVIWEKKRDAFINAVKSIGTTSISLTNPMPKIILSYEACEMLKELSEKDDSTIIKVSSLSGTTIQYGRKAVGNHIGQREFSKWDSAIDELIKNGFIKRIGKKDEIYQITNAGYEQLESIDN